MFKIVAKYLDAFSVKENAVSKIIRSDQTAGLGLFVPEGLGDNTKQPIAHYILNWTICSTHTSN